MVDPSAPDFGQGEIIAQLLECCKYPSVKTQIYPTYFFARMCEHVLDATSTPPKNFLSPDLLSFFKGIVFNLLDIAVEQSAMGEEMFLPTSGMSYVRTADWRPAG